MDQIIGSPTAAPFDQIISRAFASLADFVALSDHLLGFDGEWLAMKGRADAQEMTGLPSSVSVVEQRALEVPGCVFE